MRRVAYLIAVLGAVMPCLPARACTLSISSSDGGWVTTPGEGIFNYNKGTDVSIEVTTDIGYMVDRWYLDGNEVDFGSTTYILSNIQTDHTIHVTFEQIYYWITPSAGPNGSIYPDDILGVGYGGGQWYRAHPDTGYGVDAWYVDGSIVQTGGSRYRLGNVQADHTVHVTFKRLLSYSLDNINFEDEQEFASRVSHNNLIDPDDPERSRVHVERVTGLELDPKGVMLMRNLRDLDPDSPDYGRIVTARAKGLFAKTSADEILIQFKYLFTTSAPGVELVVYLSDVSELLAHDDPRRQQHYLEVGRIPAPPIPRPGSTGSGRFAVFEKIVWTGHLDLTKGVWIELELIGGEGNALLSTHYMAGKSIYPVRGPRSYRALSTGTSILIDDWNPAVQCYGICLDINWDNFVDEVDFLMVISECGYTATGQRACLDGAFSTDGYVDSYDIVSWDWAMHSEERLLNFCGVPLVSAGSAMMSTVSAYPKGLSKQLPLIDLPSNLSDLLIVGKRGTSDAPSKLKDRVYAFDRNGLCTSWTEPASQRCNIRLVQGHTGELYLLNSETGLLRLGGTNEAVVPSGTVKLTTINEPRYNQPATVYVGIQGKGPDSSGRPILDAAFDANHAYVVPVVVDPVGSEPYTAAAKLRLLGTANPPYAMVQLYDDPPLKGDNQYRDALREIEVDRAGNIYVLNVHSLNESDILFRYEPNGTVERLDLGNPNSDSYLPAPVAMYMSKTTNMLYLASSQYNPADTNSTVIYEFSTKPTLAIKRSITIHGMHHVTGITEDPATGSLWVAGFNMEAVPLYPNPRQPPFYHPYLAEIPKGSNNVQLISLLDPVSHDLALPMSIVWTAQAK